MGLGSEMASQCPRAASVKPLSTWQKPARSDGDREAAEGKETEEDRQKGKAEWEKTPIRPTPEIGFIWNQNKSLSHKSQQLCLDLSRLCDEIYCGRWGGKKRSKLFLGRLWWIGELSTADTCQGFWGYNREAFRKKGGLLTIAGGYVWCTVHVCMSVCLFHCVNADIILWGLCNHWMTHFHISSIHRRPPSDLRKILGMLPCSIRALSSAAWASADEQGPSKWPLSALFGQLLRPMAACHPFSKPGVDTLWFLAPVTNWGSSTPPRELFISSNPIWTFCMFFFPSIWQMDQNPKSFHECVFKFSWNGKKLYPNLTDEVEKCII